MITWLCDKKNSWEVDWIDYLFENVTPKGPIVVYNRTVDIKKYLENNSNIFVLIHLSDEWSKDPVDHYDKVKFVLRNYYKDLGPNVINFPLGWMKTFPYKLTPKSISQRNLVWSFSGHVDKTTRPQMVEWMNTIPNGKGFFIKCGQGYNLTPVELAHMYNDSYFVPCPKGNCSIDSLRVCEALQVGSIPIVEKSDYWKNLYGSDVPFIQLDNWNEAPDIINSLIKNLDSLENVRVNMYNWWIEHCNLLKSKIEKINL